jgi:hypothetical protein
MANIWYSKPFCECQPYCSRFADNMLGWEQPHLDVFHVESEEAEFDKEADQGKKFRLMERDFQRWFNEIQGRG